ncbi:MAG: Replication factor C small subunit, partial [Nitrososphaerota archaeon]
LLEQAIAGKMEEVRNSLRTILYVNGASERDLISQIYRDIFYLSIPEKNKLELLSLLGEVDFRISQGANPEIQLMMFLAHLYSASKPGK